MAKKKKSIVANIFKGIGIVLLLGAVGFGLACIDPGVRTWVANSWTDLVNHFKPAAEAAEEAAKMIVIK